MKILIVSGSPRQKGNSGTICSKLTSMYEEKGNDVTYLYLNGLKMIGCQGCLSCRKNNTMCIQKDELGEMLESFLTYDLFVMATPNYYGFIAGQMKCFMDRWYCFKDNSRRTKFGEGKKIFFIVTQGSPNRDHSRNIIEWSKYVFEGFGLKYYGYVVPNCSFESNDMVNMKMQEIVMHINMFI
jgi:multimeric flavodoxin WrbA